MKFIREEERLRKKGRYIDEMSSLRQLICHSNWTGESASITVVDIINFNVGSHSLFTVFLSSSRVSFVLEMNVHAPRYDSSQFAHSFIAYSFCLIKSSVKFAGCSRACHLNIYGIAQIYSDFNFEFFK
jgi:hypothetical protein